MPEVSWDTFERYRQKGLDARRAGQWDSARIYLLEAARAMTILAKDAQGEDLQQGRRDMAAKLLDPFPARNVKLVGCSDQKSGRD